MTPSSITSSSNDAVPPSAVRTAGGLEDLFEPTAREALGDVHGAEALLDDRDGVEERDEQLDVVDVAGLCMRLPRTRNHDAGLGENSES